jgi:sulfide dehydrogenase cytochrome subunit
MIFKKLSGTAVFACLTLGFGSVAMAADAKLISGASPEMLANTCAGCHGPEGASAGPGTPTIAGLSTEYFMEVMQGFKSGEVPSTIMERIAKGYSDEEFKQMAGYFGSKPFVMATGQKFDAGQAEKGAKLHEKYCEKCHENGGRPLAPTKDEDEEADAGILAGQWQPYLRATLADYIKGDREATKKMKKKLKSLLDKKGEKGVEALMHYYASQK